MEIAPLLVGVGVVSLYGLLWIGGPIWLGGWLRKRREQAIRRQIVLTEALDGRLGPIVAPVVETPLWGPWRVRIAVPFGCPARLTDILAVVHEVLVAIDGTRSDRYQIVLTPSPEPSPEGGGRPTRRSAAGWGREAVAAR